MTHQVAAIAGGLCCAPGPVRLTVELPNLFVSHKIRALIYIYIIICICIYIYDVYM